MLLQALQAKLTSLPFKDVFGRTNSSLDLIFKLLLHCTQNAMAFDCKLHYIIRELVHVIKATTLQGLNLNDECHKMLLHWLSPGNVILCPVRDLCHLESLSFLLVICRILAYLHWERRHTSLESVHLRLKWMWLFRFSVKHTYPLREDLASFPNSFSYL